jgi:alpha-1,6-mannosyltransferase
MQNNSFFKYTFLIAFVIAISYLGFFVERTNFVVLLTNYAIAFSVYFFYVKKTFSDKESKLLIALGLGLRLVLCFAFPRLSDDIYRFFWDGKLICGGYNPFAYLPSYFIDNQIFTSDFDIGIFKKLNSPNYYSIYPPVCQVVFSAAYWLSSKSIYGAAVLMKLFLLFCEIGTIFLLYKNEKRYDFFSKNAALLYALNPLCIIEICGNLHFEGAMIFFFLICIFSQAPNIQSSLFYALSICSKLLTLIFLPLLFLNFIKERKIKWAFFSSTMTLIFVTLFFSPLIDKNFFANFVSSLNLYYQKFEFNASLYYVGKVVSTYFIGYNPIQYVSGALSLVVILNILIQYFRHITIFNKLFWTFFVYLLCQSIVHPWYLTTLVLLSILANKRIGILWSGLVFLSYSHYQNGFYQENFYLIGLEYFVLIAYFVYPKFRSYDKENLLL